MSLRSVAVADAVALVAFVVVGVLTHDASVTAFVRDGLCLLGAWFAVALVVRLYTRPGWWRLAATWLVGVSLGVLLRAAFVGHWPGVFYGIALAFTAVFVVATRLLRNLVAAP